MRNKQKLMLTFPLLNITFWQSKLKLKMLNSHLQGQDWLKFLKNRRKHRSNWSKRNSLSLNLWMRKWLKLVAETLWRQLYSNRSFKGCLWN